MLPDGEPIPGVSGEEGRSKSTRIDYQQVPKDLNAAEVGQGYQDLLQQCKVRQQEKINKTITKVKSMLGDSASSSQDAGQGGLASEGGIIRPDTNKGAPPKPSTIPRGTGSGTSAK